MATLRDLRKRVKTVKSTEKITKAMKMVAASKLRRAQNAILEARPYALRMDEVLQHIVSRADVKAHPLLSYRVPKRVELVVMTSNRGLCGGFNSSIIRAAENFLKENEDAYDSIQVSTIGKKARDHFGRKGLDAGEYAGIWEQLEFARATEVSVDLSDRFKRGELDAVYLIYNEFKSAISQNLRLKQLLPIRPLDNWQENPAAKIGELAAISGDQSAVAGNNDKLSPLEEGGRWGRVSRA